ncbi:MAG TPA: sensor domain-containing diguanylate cyclase [bacterium]|nr:sensor domain-containing diguanylate cyclase [bacterium]
MKERPGSEPPRGHSDKALAFLARLATELTVVLSFGELVDGTLNMLSEEAGFDSCSVGLIDEAKDVVTVVGAAGLRAGYKGLTIPHGRSLNWTVVESRQPLYVPDMHGDGRVYRQQDDIHSGIYAPLMVRGRVIGVLSAHRSAVDAFKPEDLDVLTVVARYLAGAIEVSRLYEELRSLASTDELTRLPNRRSILERFGAELSRALRDAQPLSVAIVDLDELKQVNDSLGHQVGDAVLVHVADVLRRRIRVHDIAGRLAGDEFILLFPNTDRDQAETILRRLERIDASGSGQPGDRAMTLSWGLATWPEDGAAVDALIAVADRHLYMMKRAHLTERHGFVAPDAVSVPLPVERPRAGELEGLGAGDSVTVSPEET